MDTEANAKPYQGRLKRTLRARIDELSGDGLGIAKGLNREIWIHDALVGEEVLCAAAGRSGAHDLGRVIERFDQFDRSPLRVKPQCPAYADCGACSLQHMSHHGQVEHKQNVLLSALRNCGNLQPEQMLAPIVADSWNYRRRARLGVRWVEAKQRIVVGFRERWNKRRIVLSPSCDILAGNFGDYLEPLAEMIAGLSIATRIPQIELAVAENRTALVFRVLDRPSAGDLDQLRKFAHDYQFSIYLQPGGLDSVERLDSESPELYYCVDGGKIELRFAPFDFIQINAGVNQQLIDRVLSLLELDGSQWVVDLYCGIGNFSLPVARRARWVSAMEGDIGLVNRAKSNALHNGITNVEIHAENLDSIPNWMEYWGYADCVLLDPPRLGAPAVVSWLSQLRPRKILYVACSPYTLARDAQVLVEQGHYKLKAACIADMFPHTAHVESLALFEQSASI